METTLIKLPPNFDIRSPLAAHDWKVWKCLFQDYLIGSGQDGSSDKVKLSLLLNMMGPESAKVIITFKLKKEESENFEKVIQAIDTYVNPKINEVFERYKFNERKQEEGETFENYFTCLRQLIGTCDYLKQDGESLEDQLLRDRIVQGVFDKSVQENLLRRDHLTLDLVTKICRASELSKAQIKEMNPTFEIDAAKKKTMGKNQKFNCRRCQRLHGPKECPAFGKKCSNCGIENHFAVSCRVKNRKVQEVKCENEESDGSEYYCGAVISGVNKSDWVEDILIEDQIVKCKLDTGADVSIMPLNVFEKVNKNLNLKLRDTDLKIETFAGDRVRPVGIANLLCKYKNVECYENFVVVNCNTMLLGLPGCISLKMIKRVHAVHSDEDKNKFISQNIEVFEGIGRLPENVEIPTRNMEDQICHPSARIPNCMLEPLKQELERLESRESIVKVTNIHASACVNRVVIVEKHNGKVRLCLDPTDLNKYIVKKPKMLPTLDDLALKLKGKKIFSVLDLTEGFHHLKLSEASSWKCCFATPFGVYRYLVLPYGLMNAPELFQDVLESHFGGIQNVVIWADDILVMGSSDQEHNVALSSVMIKAKQLGIVFNKDKFQFRQKEVKYVGQIFNEKGMSLDDERVESLVKLKEPKDRDGLRQVLGAFNYVRRYVPEMASLMSPLCKLLKKDCEFTWLPAHQRAFEELKLRISSAPALTPFDVNKKIILQCDASKNGVGCCLFQRDEKEMLRLVTCASRTMNDAEVNYSQTEKEMLAICFAVKKFHRYIYGSEILVQTDHKPIVAIMGKHIGKIGSPRLRRMRLKLLMYHLNVQYVPGKLVHFADMLSRNSLMCSENDKDTVHLVHSASVHLPMSPERKTIFRKETNSDSVLNLICKYYHNEWPEKTKLPKECMEYYNFKDDIYFEAGLAFNGNKLIVPKNLKSYVLNLVHEGHAGISKCIKKARQLFYWPGLSQDVHNFVMRCRTCEKFRPANSHEPLLPHRIPKLRFSKVGSDILEFLGRSFLVIVDYLSHWLEIIPIPDKTSVAVINAFQEVFMRFGYPVELIADNNPFISRECLKYFGDKDISLITSSPHYPRSNGMAEKAVHIGKNILKKATEDKVDYRDYLMCYNNTPLAGLDVSPSQILNSRQVRTKLPVNADLLKPVVQCGIHKLLELRQTIAKDKFNMGIRKKETVYSAGEKIVHKTGKDKYWRKGTIVKKCVEPRSYWIVDKSTQRQMRRNTSHLRKSYSNDNVIQRNDMDFGFEQDVTIPSANMPEAVEPPSSVAKPLYKVTRSGRFVKPPEVLDL